MIDLLQEIIAAIGVLDYPVYMLDSTDTGNRVVVSYTPIPSQTDDYISNDMLYIDLFLDKLSFNGKSIHNIKLLDDTCKLIVNRIANYEAVNKLYNITYLGRPIVQTQKETDKSEALIRFQITTKTVF